MRDHQPFRYLRHHMKIPDGWFDYPASVNRGRRLLHRWLLARVVKPAEVVSTSRAVVQCPEGTAHCLAVPLTELELRWCDEARRPREGRFFERFGGHELSCKTELWEPRLECWRRGHSNRAAELVVKYGRMHNESEHLGRLCAEGEESPPPPPPADFDFSYVIPEGAGRTLRVPHPRTGQLLTFPVPQGVGPGTTVTLRAPGGG